RDLDLRQALERYPGFALAVYPAAPTLGRDHVLDVHGSTSALGSGDGNDCSDSGTSLFGMTRQELQQYIDAGKYDIGEFQASLDGMIALASAASDALTSWPMPPM
ncbi:MAG: hypothetical protein VB071_06015, partial [Lawsonibacter sp.]|nr:hypothetical protein [Lawsonibacter sp.]